MVKDTMIQTNEAKAAGMAGCIVRLIEVSGIEVAIGRVGEIGCGVDKDSWRRRAGDDLDAARQDLHRSTPAVVERDRFLGVSVVLPPAWRARSPDVRWCDADPR